MMDVREKINAGHYNNTDEYPSRPVKPSVLSKKAGSLTPEEMASLAQVAADYEKANEEYKAAKTAWGLKDAERLSQFEADLAAEHGVENHPKRYKLYSLAWEKGHSYGLSEVASYYDDFIVLIED